MGAPLEKAKAVIALRKSEGDDLLATLLAIQDKLGFVPDTAVDPLATTFGTSATEVRKTVSFYADTLRLLGEGACVVRVCLGDTCVPVGAQAVYEAVGGEVARGPTRQADRPVLFASATCLGNCDEGPSLEVEGRLYAQMTPVAAAEVVREALLAPAGSRPRKGA